MPPNPRLRTWLRAGGANDDRVLEAQQVALLVADGGYLQPRDGDVPIVETIRIDDQVEDGLAELHEDGLYYMSAGTARREVETSRVTVIDGRTGECLAQGWLEPETGVAPDPSTPPIQPFVAARPSGLSNDGIGRD